MYSCMKAAQQAARPSHLDSRQRRLRGHGVGAEHRVREAQLPEHGARRRRARRVERHKHVRCAGRQVLQQVQPVADAHRGVLAPASRAALSGQQSCLQCSEVELQVALKRQRCQCICSLRMPSTRGHELHLPRKFQDAQAARLRGMRVASVCSHTSFSL